MNGSSGFSAGSSLFKAWRSWVKPPCAMGAGSEGRDGVWKENVLDDCAGAGSGRRDLRGSSAGVLSSGFGANICVNDPGPEDCCGAEGGTGAGGGCTASFAPVSDWNIWVKSPGPDCAGFAGGCGAGGEYIGMEAVGCGSPLGLSELGLELEEAETELKSCVKDPDVVACAGGTGGAGGADGTEGAAFVSGFCAEAVSVCRS